MKLLLPLPLCVWLFGLIALKNELRFTNKCQSNSSFKTSPWEFIFLTKAHRPWHWCDAMNNTENIMHAYLDGLLSKLERRNDFWYSKECTKDNTCLVFILFFAFFLYSMLTFSMEILVIVVTFKLLHYDHKR